MEPLNLGSGRWTESVGVSHELDSPKLHVGAEALGVLYKVNDDELLGSKMNVGN